MFILIVTSGWMQILYHRFSSQRLDLYSLISLVQSMKWQDGATQHVFLRDAFHMSSHRSQSVLCSCCLFLCASQAFTLPSVDELSFNTGKCVFNPAGTSLATFLCHISSLHSYWYWCRETLFPLSFGAFHGLSAGLCTQGTTYHSRYAPILEAAIGLAF